MTSIEILNGFSAENLEGSQLATSGNGYFAFSSGKTILLNRFDTKEMEQMHLEGHHSDINALCMSTFKDKTVLASSGSYYIILWDVQQVEESFKAREQMRGEILAELENNPPKALSFSKQNAYLCALHLNEITVYDIHDKYVVWSKFGAKYSEALFLNEQSVLISLEDSRIEIWNFKDDFLTWASPLFQNSVVSITTEINGNFVVGFSNNVVRSFEMCGNVDDSPDFRKKFDIDLDMEMFRFNSGDKLEETATHSQILAVFAAQSDTAGDGVHSFRWKILCATNVAIFVIDVMSQNVEILHLSDFEVGFISSASFCRKSCGTVFCIGTPLFNNNIIVLQLRLPEQIQKNELFSVLPKISLVENSLLKKTLVSSKLQKKTVKNKDNPLTFHTKIRSSGYNAKPVPHKMFQPSTTFHDKPKVTRKIQQKLLLKNPQRSYDWTSPIQVVGTTATSDNPTNTNHISVSECNRYLSCSLQNNDVVVLQQKTKKYAAALCGHNGPVTTSFWNSDSTSVVTSSADCSCKIWSFSQPEKPILNLDILSGNLGKSSEKIPKEVMHSQFYYMDKFIILYFGNSFGLYSYHIDDGPKSDVKRYLDKNKYKLVKLISLSGAQSITGFAAPNNIYSYVALACGSDKMLRVFDMNVGSEISKIEGIHSRPASQIIQSTGSAFVQSLNYDLFATTAPSDGVKLWDLRSRSCTAKFMAHPNNGVCPLDIAPCGMYLAVAGEDRCIYIYDIRKASQVQKTSQQKDRISSLRFSKDGCEIYLGMRNGDLVTVANM